jgi:CubicO group peptidase (beta-lactamase class C family)
MTNKMLIFAIGFLLTFNFLSANAQNRESSLEDLYKNETAGNFSGSMVVADNGKIIFQRSKGYADIAGKRLNDASTNFSLASLSKVFTAVAVMQLKEENKINLDDPLIKYLSDFPFPDITIRQILSHTSGLPNFEIFDHYKRPSGQSFLSYRDIMPALKQGVKTLSAPGTEWHYSNIGFGLLAMLVETVSHQPFPLYFSEHIARPAGLVNTYVEDPGCQGCDPSKAVLYIHPTSPTASFSATDTLVTDLSDPIQTIAGPGLVISSINDLLKFDEALYGDHLLKAATRAEMFKPAKLANGAFVQLEHAPLYNTLGWGEDIDSSAGTIVSHTGGSPGISTIFVRNISKHQTVIILENTDNHAVIPLGVNAMNVLNDRPLIHFRAD